MAEVRKGKPASSRTPGQRAGAGGRVTQLRAVGPAVPSELRNRLVLALDVDDSVVAMRWAARMRPWFGVAKIGLELFSAAGPSIVAELGEAGFRVFADLKLADIPTTTRKAARVLGTLGVSYLTVHAFNGAAALRAGVEGLEDGAAVVGLPAPMALAVTVLTSQASAPEETLRERARAALEAGCGGFVCAAPDLKVAKAVAPDLVAVVPGIRPTGAGTDDQARVATPAEAVLAGADMLVVGRAVTRAADPEAAAAAIVDELASLGAIWGA
jgi:orotidine-5'-phosphate decarboxylase